MKKIVVLTLAVLLLISLSGCSNKGIKMLDDITEFKSEYTVTFDYYSDGVLDDETITCDIEEEEYTCNGDGDTMSGNIKKDLEGMEWLFMYLYMDKDDFKEDADGNFIMSAKGKLNYVKRFGEFQWQVDEYDADEDELASEWAADFGEIKIYVKESVISKITVTLNYDTEETYEYKFSY